MLDTRVLHHAHATATDKVEPNTCRDIRKTQDVAKWQESCDEEMTNLKHLHCWDVVPLTSVPPGTPIMGSRWTFKAKTDQNAKTDHDHSISLTPRLPRVLPTQRRELLGIILTRRVIHKHTTAHRSHSPTAMARYTLRRIRRLHHRRNRPYSASNLLSSRGRIRIGS